MGSPSGGLASRRSCGVLQVRRPERGQQHCIFDALGFSGAQRAVTTGGRGPSDLRPRVVAGAEPGGGGRNHVDAFEVVADPEVADVIERNL